MMVSCQKLHKGNKLSRLFRVSADPAVPRIGDSADIDVSQVIEMSLSKATAQLEESEKKNNIIVHADTDR
jgi:hypothetical protein